MDERPRLHKRVEAFLFDGDVRRRISTAVIAGLVVAAVFGIVSLVRACGDDDQPIVVVTAPEGVRTATQSKPENRADEISQRDYWVNPPQLYEPVPDEIETACLANPLTMVALDALQADVLALAPRELVDNAALYEDEPFFIVGRVIDTFSRQAILALDVRS